MPESAKFIVATFFPLTVSMDLTSIGNLSNFFSDTAVDNYFNLSSKLRLSFTSMVLDSLGSKEFSSTE